MILLDSDHLSVLEIPGNERRNRLVANLALARVETLGTTIVNVEEQFKGWIAAVAKERQFRRQIRAYGKLAALLRFFRPFHIALFDDRSAELVEKYGSIRIGTSDRKIAAITVANNALLLTANRRDFEQVPGLRFQNWMDGPLPAP